MAEQEKNGIKTMRTAFIRVTAVNNTEKGLVEYSQKDIYDICEEFSSRYSGLKYAFICHNKDKDPVNGEPKKNHFHVVLKLEGKNSIRFQYVKELFPYGDIESARSVNAAIQYLLHLNNPEKTQYERSEIVSNFSESALDKYLSTTDGQNSTSKKLVDDIIRKIDDGTIREYNKSEYIDSVTLARNDRLFRTAFKNRSERIMLNQNRDIQVYFITGEPGAGKTTFAKQIAAKIGNGSYYISGSNNDSMQDYKGQDTLILDDLRDCSFEFNDILKILDNHTSTAIKSRFYNKVFLGKAIIITSCSSVFDWYSFTTENRAQFYRRITVVYKMDKDYIYGYTLNPDESGEYELRFQCKMMNPVIAQYKAEEKAKEDAVGAAIDMLRDLVNNIEVSDELRDEIQKSFIDGRLKAEKSESVAS